MRDKQGKKKKTCGVPSDELPEHSNRVDSVSLFDDFGFEDLRSDGVVVIADVGEQDGVAEDLDQVQHDSDH